MPDETLLSREYALWCAYQQASKRLNAAHEVFRMEPTANHADAVQRASQREFHAFVALVRSVQD